MAMGQQKDRQGDLMVGWAEMPRSPGHVFYDRLQSVLIEGGFDAFAEASCRPYYAARMGAPSVPPGRYFRMHLVGYFEGIDSERGLEWRCSDSLSLREFLRLGSRERVPDHSWLSKTRARLPHEVHAAVFDWVLALIGEAGLVKGERIGVDASTMEANAALRNIVRRDTGEGYREMLEHLARESGIETPTAEDLARLDRKRKGKKLSNEDWVSKSDPEAKIAKMKDGTTHLAYKPEHAVDLDTGAVVAAELHPADEGDTTTLPKTLETAKENLASVDAAPTAEDPAECVTDKGYHSRAVLKALDNGPWKTRIAEPKQKGFARWRGDEAARRAVTNNRTRLLSGVAKEAFKLRAEIVERSFAHNLDRGGMRRTWLRGRENVHKRYLLHVAGHKPIVADAPTHRRRHPARGRGGRIWRYFRAAHAHRGHAGRTGGLAKRPDGFRCRIPHLGVRAGKSHLINGLLRGSDGRALDLVLVVDTTTGEFGDRDSARVRQRIEALGRALDVTGSRYVVTVILAGAALGKDMEVLAESCRVLHVDGLPLDADGELANDAARNQLEDRISVLLPLTLPPPLVVTEDGSGPAMDQLVRVLPRGVDKTLLAAVTDASQEGEQAVTEAMASMLGAALVMEEGQ